MDEKHDRPGDARTEEEVAADARQLITWLVDQGDAIVKEGAFDRLIVRFVPELRDMTANLEDEDASEAAASTVEFLEEDADIEELFLDDPSELEAWFTKYIARVRKRSRAGR
jgi:hypothetical protein